VVGDVAEIGLEPLRKPVGAGDLFRQDFEDADAQRVGEGPYQALVYGFGVV
jgi:hypothetical protein